MAPHLREAEKQEEAIHELALAIEKHRPEKRTWRQCANAKRNSCFCCRLAEQCCSRPHILPMPLKLLLRVKTVGKNTRNDLPRH